MFYIVNAYKLTGINLVISSGHYNKLNSYTFILFVLQYIISNNVLFEYNVFIKKYNI